MRGGGKSCLLSVPGGGCWLIEEEGRGPEHASMNMDLDRAAGMHMHMTGGGCGGNGGSRGGGSKMGSARRRGG
jgi:hypothetical protein